MSLTADGFWNGRFWSESFWVAGFWYEPATPVPAVGPMGSSQSWAQPKRSKRRKDNDILLLLLG